MAARSALVPILRRTALKTRTSGGALRAASGGYTPPVPPFARNLKPSEKLVEEHDLIWDDGVAPEVTIDFDCQHISKGEGLAWWLGGLGFFSSLATFCYWLDPSTWNPAVGRKMNMVVEDAKIGPPTEDEK